MHGEGPWYLRAPVRLTFLLVVLAGVAAYGVPRIVRAGGWGSAHGCSTGTPPPLAKLTPVALGRALGASGADQLIGEGFPDVEGLAEPTQAWTDSIPSVLPTGAAVDGGYEIRWWSDQYDHQSVDVFVFATAADARAYVRMAARARCRRLAISYSTPELPGGRGLFWNNPVAASQGDVFFARGNRAYRLTEVGPGDLASRLLVDIAQRLACELPEAGCRHPVSPGALDPAGYFASDTLPLPVTGAREVGGAGLPPGHRVPGLPVWVSDRPSQDALTFAAGLAGVFQWTGLWPVLWSGPGDPAGYMAGLRKHARFRTRIPRLGPGSVRVDRTLNPFELYGAYRTPRYRLLLVPCRRPADAAAVLGLGRGDAELSDALRSWEDRYRAEPVAFGPGDLELAASAPPPHAPHLLQIVF
jgi:hypothetical protein